MYRKEKQNY